MRYEGYFCLPDVKQLWRHRHGHPRQNINTKTWPFSLISVLVWDIYILRTGPSQGLSRFSSRDDNSNKTEMMTFYQVLVKLFREMDDWFLFNVLFILNIILKGFFVCTPTVLPVYIHGRMVDREIDLSD